MTDQHRPSIGRIVHCISDATPPRSDDAQAFPPERRAARVTEAGAGDPGRVGLVLPAPTGQSFHPLAVGGAAHADAAAHLGGTWRWPERA